MRAAIYYCREMCNSNKRANAFASGKAVKFADTRRKFAVIIVVNGRRVARCYKVEENKLSGY